MVLVLHLGNKMSRKMTTMFYIIFVSFIDLEDVTSRSITTTSQTNVRIDSSIVLNCSFEVDSNETVRRVNWRKINSNTFTDLAEFTPADVIIMDNRLKDKSKLLPFGQNSTSAVLIINEVKCEDEGNYECVVLINEDNSVYTRMFSNTTVYIQGDAEPPFELSLQPNSSLEEHDNVNVSCSANLNLNGNIKIWTKESGSDSQRVVLNNSSLLDIRRQNCSTIARLTIPYKLTRDDQGAMFGCTSESKQTQDLDLSRQIGPITIFYGPSNVSITASRPHDNLLVGYRIKLTCTSNGNPKPNIAWTLNSTDIVNGGTYKLLNNNATLEFTIQSIHDSGCYYCVASNYFNGKTAKTNSCLFLTVREEIFPHLNLDKSCSTIACPFIKKCSEDNGTATCSMDVWKVIAFVFIALSLSLGMASTNLLLRLRIRNRRFIPLRDGVKSSNTVLKKKTDTLEEDFCGYAEPKDVKRPDLQNIWRNDGRDNPYEDPVDFKFLSRPFIPESSSSDTNVKTLANSQVREDMEFPVNSLDSGDVPNSDEFPIPSNFVVEAWV